MLLVLEMILFIPTNVQILGKSNQVFFFNVCSIKFCSKHSSNTVQCLLPNLMEQSLLIRTFYKLLNFTTSGPVYKNPTYDLQGY